MKRRDFVLKTAGAATLPMLIQGLPLNAFDGPLIHELLNTDVPTDRVLVLIQLNGGNCGLNTLVPLDQYGVYQRERSNIAIPENKTIKITDQAGLHPNLTTMKTLWDDKKMGVVQGVGYPSTNYSHFRSFDVVMSGSDAMEVVTTGWMGRYLNAVYPGYPVGYPTEQYPDPPAIQVGAVPTLAMIGSEQRAAGIALQNPDLFYNLVSGTELSTDDLPEEETPRGHLEYIREVQTKANQYSKIIKKAAEKADNASNYPDSPIAKQLKIVARLVKGGLSTRLYMVNLSGFDHHAGQTDKSDPTQGSHADLLKTLSEAIKCFQDDIEKLGIADRVLAMTFSEFGRRVASNGSYGSDHGSSAPVLIFGTNVEAGITGNSPNLQDLDNGNLKLQFDFRQVYSSVLEQWFGAKPEVIREVLFKDYNTVKVIKASSTSVKEEPRTVNGCSLNPIAPNPVRDAANIRFTLRQTERVKISVFDALGFHVATMFDKEHDAGQYSIPFEMSGQPSGTYLVQAQIGSTAFTQTFIKIR